MEQNRSYFVNAYHSSPTLFLLFCFAAVIAMSVKRSSANKLRCEVMLIISCMTQLNDLGVKEILDDLSEDRRNDICRDIITLQASVQRIIQFVPSTEFRAIHEKCLCQVDALVSTVCI